jgi:hypothetical protein
LTGPIKSGDVRVLPQNNAAYRDAGAIKNSASPGVVRLLTQAAPPRAPAFQRAGSRFPVPPERGEKVGIAAEQRHRHQKNSISRITGQW